MPKCPHCEKNVMGNKELNAHVESMHGDSKFKCNQCEFESSRKDVSKRHVESMQALCLN